MARLLIYDSDAIVDQSGKAVDMRLQNLVGKASQPVRLYGSVDGPIHDIGYEMLFEGSTGVAPTSPIDLYWHQEFYNDVPTRSLPSGRAGADINSSYSWCREQLQYGDGSAGDNVTTILYHYDIVRQKRVADGLLYFVTGDPITYHRALYFPCRVHALFVRLQIAVGNLPAAGAWRLRAWAIVGGQDQQVAQEAQTLPYAAEL